MARLWYQIGRILTYSLLGGLMGMMGEIISIAGWQQGLSILAGLLMVFLALSLKLPGFSKLKRHGISFAPIKKGISGLLRQQPSGASFMIGSLNGLLPCGLVYMALVGAVGSGNTLDGALYMTLFGLGTLPMMLSVSLLTKWATPKLRIRINKAVPLVVIFIGLLLVIRGLNLGIPYVSPEISLLPEVDVSMCQE